MGRQRSPAASKSAKPLPSHNPQWLKPNRMCSMPDLVKHRPLTTSNILARGQVRMLPSSFSAGTDGATGVMMKARSNLFVLSNRTELGIAARTTARAGVTQSGA